MSDPRQIGRMLGEIVKQQRVQIPPPMPMDPPSVTVEAPSVTVDAPVTVEVNTAPIAEAISGLRIQAGDVTVQGPDMAPVAGALQFFWEQGRAADAERMDALIIALEANTAAQNRNAEAVTRMARAIETQNDIIRQPKSVEYDASGRIVKVG